MKRVEQISDQILKYSRNELLVSLRFMDLALCKLIYRIGNIQRIATDGKYLYYNPKYIFKLYEISNTELNHSHLHSIFHCIFYHPFVDKTIERRLWDLACDIAVEGIISELEIGQLEFATSINISQELARLKSKYGKLTAERLYRKLLDSNLNDEEVQRLQNLFCFDDHFIWYIENNKEVQELIKSTQKGLNALGYTEHSSRHISIVSNRAGKVLEALDYPKERIELAKIAGFMHDIGNCVNRVDHAHSGAVLAYEILKDMGMDVEKRTEIMMAIRKP